MKNTILNVITIAGILIAVSIENSFAQKIRTVAGNGTDGLTGDGAAAIYGTIGKAQGITTDLHGNIYISDVSMNVVRKINTAGLISTVAGNGYPSYSGDGGAATAASLAYPYDLATDSHGNLYIADDANFSIRKVDTNGIITTVVGDGSHAHGYSGDGGPATAALLNGCLGITFDKNDNLYIADGNTAVRKVGTDGIITTVAGGHLYGYYGDGGAATLAALAGPCGIVVDTLGNIYFSEQLNNVIRKVNTSGIISTLAGNTTASYAGDGSAAISASLYAPSGLAIDNEGSIYVADESNNRIRKIATLGIITSISGTGVYHYTGDDGSAATATLNSPSAVCTDANGNLFISDMENFAVREILNLNLLTISSSEGTSIAEGTNVTFTVPSVTGYYGLIYQWSVNGANAGTNDHEFETATLNNGDVISCTIADPLTGVVLDTASIKMNVYPLGTPALHTTTTSIAMWPNPNNGSFTLTGNLSAPAHTPAVINVFDAAGRLQYTTQVADASLFSQGGVAICSSLPAGQYVACVNADSITANISFQIIK